MLGRRCTFENNLVVVFDSRLGQSAKLQATLALQIDDVFLAEELGLSIVVELIFVLDLYRLADMFVGAIGCLDCWYGELGERNIGVLEAEVGFKGIQVGLPAGIRQEDAVQVQVKVVRRRVEQRL